MNEYLFFWAMMAIAVIVLVVMAIEALIMAGIHRIRARNRRRWIQLDWDNHDDFIDLENKRLIHVNRRDVNGKG